MPVSSNLFIRIVRLFVPEFNLNKKVMKYDSDVEYETYLKLKKIFANKKYNPASKKLRIYSPGSGSDVLTILMIYDAIVSSSVNRVEFVFVDIRDFFEGCIEQFRKYAPGCFVIRRKKKNCWSVDIIYKDKIFELSFIIDDAIENFPAMLKQGYDIYYERAFEIFRSSSSMYPGLKNLNDSGLMITDSGMDFGSLKKEFKRLKGIPKKFGLYNQFQIWQKK